MTDRAARVRKQILEQASRIIHDKIKDPRVGTGFVTVTDVEVSRDLRHATIFLSTMKGGITRQKSLEALEHAKGYIRTELGRSVRMKYLAEIELAFDESVEEGDRIERLIKEVRAREEADGQA
jgi:ribosome-binding factor A